MREGNIAAVGARDVAGDGEAESAGERARMGEGFEEEGEIFLGNRRAGVFDPELDAAAVVGIGAQEYGMVGGGSSYGKGEETGEGKMNLRLVDEGREIGGRGDDEFEIT